MIFIKKNLFQIVLMGFLIVAPILSFAQAPASVDVDPIDTQGKIVNPIKVDTINGFIKT
ncbi:MAG: hypothetical protein US65_C0021G0001, partial [Candidatus Yanofskybacteria bacterium GW2011_GWC2_37_9]